MDNKVTAARMRAIVATFTKVAEFRSSLGPMALSRDPMTEARFAYNARAAGATVDELWLAWASFVLSETPNSLEARDCSGTPREHQCKKFFHETAARESLPAMHHQLTSSTVELCVDWHS